jgi:hypothetical protein
MKKKVIYFLIALGVVASAMMINVVVSNSSSVKVMADDPRPPSL